MGGSSARQTIDEQEQLVLPDLPSGRLLFYAHLAWMRQGPGGKKASRLAFMVKALKDGLCPRQLLEEVIEHDLLESNADGTGAIDALGARELKDIIHMLQVHREDAGIGSFGADAGFVDGKSVKKSSGVNMQDVGRRLGFAMLRDTNLEKKPVY